MRVLRTNIIRQRRKKQAVLSVSKEHEHKGLKVSAELCLNLCLFRCQKSFLNLLRSLVPKFLFSVGLIKLSNFFQKPAYETILLISGSSFFHSFIVCEERVFFEDFCSTQQWLKGTSVSLKSL